MIVEFFACPHIPFSEFAEKQYQPISQGHPAQGMFRYLPTVTNLSNVFFSCSLEMPCSSSKTNFCLVFQDVYPIAVKMGEFLL